MNRIAVIGFGSFTREVIPRLTFPFDIFLSKNIIKSIDIDCIKQKYKCDVNDIHEICSKKYKALVTVSNIDIRKKLIDELSKNVDTYTFIDKSAIILDNNNQIGNGSIVCAGAIVTTNVTIGHHTHINLNTTIGHDCVIGNYCTVSPGVHISGNCKIGNNVFIGTNTSIRENITICDNVVIGMHSVIIKSIHEPGIYYGSLECKKRQ